MEEFSGMIGILPTAGDGWGQAQKVLVVPRVDDLGPGFERAVAQDAAS
jgi:hypothetical protein